jgi:glycosyltransferase involved in cell wall biosynthesis
MEQADVSIIIPVYNTEDYIADTIDSIVNQMLSNIEIIIVDDGSTDKSPQILENYKQKDPRIRIISQKNQGVSVARNRGIEEARGKYIYFMDSDDLLDPRTLLSCYQKSVKEDLDIVFFDAEIFGTVSNKRSFNYRRCYKLTEKVRIGIEMLNYLMDEDAFLVSPCLNLTKLSYLRDLNLKYYPGIIHEDELFTFSLFLHAERINFIAEPFFKRRLREDSIMTTRFTNANIIGYFTVIEQLIQLKKSEKNSTVSSLVDKRLSAMIPAILYEARGLQLMNRLGVLARALFRFNRFFSPKDFWVTLLPFLSAINPKHLKLTKMTAF